MYSDWKIFQILFFVKKILLKNNFSLLHNFYIYLNYFKVIINYFYLDYTLKKADSIKVLKNINIKIINLNYSIKFLNSLLSKTVSNIYQTDLITRNSKIMNICSTQFNLVIFQL